MTKRNTARSANLHVLVYTLLHRGAPYQVGSPSKTHSAVVGGGETQQELIPFKHKEWSVVDLVLSELTVSEMGAWRYKAWRSKVDRDKNCKTHEAPVKLLRIR